MNGQMTLYDLLTKTSPCLPKPGVYSRSGRQRITVERVGEEIEIAIWTDDEAMIARVDAEELKEYMEQVWNENQTQYM